MTNRLSGNILGDIARGAADEHIVVSEVPEVLMEDFQPLYHLNFSIISSSADSLRRRGLPYEKGRATTGQRSRVRRKATDDMTGLQSRWHLGLDLVGR